MLNHAKTQYYSEQAAATDPVPDNSLETALEVARAAEDRKADEIMVLKVSEVSYLADYFVIATGFSHVQVRAIYQSITQQIEQQFQRVPVNVEGQREGTWTLIDYGDVIVHVMLPEEREFYNLEAFWGHAERVDWSESIQ